MIKKNSKKVSYLIITGLLIFLAALFFLLLGNIKTPKAEIKNQQDTKTEQKEGPAVINDNAKIEPLPLENKISNAEHSQLKMPILMYHYIRTVSDPNDQLGINLSVTPSKFVTQLDYIQSKGYQTITFRDIEENKIPAKPIILTFDDGYEDFYTNAYPELKKRNMAAVVYVITNNDGGQYLTTNQIKELSDAGIEIGSHTLSHLDLSKSSTSKQISEITDSKKKLEIITGKNIISFCYPAGKYAEETIEITKNAGYKYATTTKPGESLFDTPLELTRHRMNGDTNIERYIK